MKRILSTAALGFSIFATASVFAADGYVTGNVNLYAGPDTSYPSVVMLSGGAAVDIEGCVDGWSWCDVASGDNRGWIAGNYLQEEYQGQRVLVPQYGVQIGIPIVGFVFATYWDAHYRNRSWYGQRAHWSQITPQYRPVAVQSGSRGTSPGNSHSSRAPTQGATEESRRAGVAATQATSHNRAANAVATQHPVATEAKAPEKSVAHTQPVQRKAVAPKAVAVRKAAPPKAAPEHKAVEQKAPPKVAPEKSAPEKEGDKDKEQH